MNVISIQQALRYLKRAQPALTRQQLLTLKGQIIHGDVAGAMRGLERLLHGKEGKHD